MKKELVKKSKSTKVSKETLLFIDCLVESKANCAVDSKVECGAG